jgi:ABC-type oligopeptide transport system substrate-binding subunit
MPSTAYLAEVSRRRTSAMGWRGWNADFPDPANFFESTLASAAIQDEGSQNVSFFADAELERVLAVPGVHADGHDFADAAKLRQRPPR